jgi:hypothetical protein
MKKSSKDPLTASSKEKDLKSEKIKRVAGATLSIIWKGGIRSLNPTRVARSANVSRPWIYKYIGGSKDALMENAVDYFGRLYSRIDDTFAGSDINEWMNHEMKALQDNFDLTVESPWILPLYYNFKGSQTAIGRGIEKIEKEYLKKKTEEVKRLIAVSDPTCRLIAELMLTYRLATVHRWQMGDLPRLMSREDLASRLRKLYEFVTTLGAPIRK